MSAVAGAWPRDVLVVRGPDALTYLQGQVTADVLALDPGASTPALLLAPNGKMCAVLRLWRTAEHVVVIDTDAGAGDSVESRMRRFLLRTDATIERLDWECVALRGQQSEYDRAVAGEDSDSEPAELMAASMWPGGLGVDLLGVSVLVPTGVAEVSSDELEVLRIRAGWPAFGAEITEEVIPAEIGAWLMAAAVSFTKGCYVGQELTARINSRGGNAPRRLRTFEVPAGSTVAAGDEIVEVGDEAGGAKGIVTSAAVDPATRTTVVMGFVHRSVPDEAVLVTRTG